jgi:hypothetical protein
VFEAVTADGTNTILLIPQNRLDIDEQLLDSASVVGTVHNHRFYCCSLFSISNSPSKSNAETADPLRGPMVDEDVPETGEKCAAAQPTTASSMAAGNPRIRCNSLHRTSNMLHTRPESTTAYTEKACCERGEGERGGELGSSPEDSCDGHYTARLQPIHPWAAVLSGLCLRTRGVG